MQFLTILPKTVHRPNTSRWCLEKLKTYIFSKNSSWNWSSGQIENTFDNTVNLLFARSPGNFNRHSEKQLQHCDFVERNFSFWSPLNIEGRFENKFFPTAVRKLFHQYHKENYKFINLSGKNCFLNVISRTRRLLFWQPCRFFFVESRNFLLRFRNIKLAFFRKRTFFLKEFLGKLD